MSEDVMSVGVMVPLNRKITEEEREEWQEILWNQGSSVHLSYYCDMAYTDEQGEAYGISFGEMPTKDTSAFEDLKQFGICIEEDKARPYRCMWYNGADSDMSMMTRKEFLKKTNQQNEEVE
jgi:hypothetical protein